jgi:hypothetical protein
MHACPPFQCARSLRAMFGTDGTRNAVHGSDSPASAACEIKFFFPHLELEPLLPAEQAKAYIAEKLQPALSKALTALAREKPAAEKFEAITFLAEYLRRNNPNKPRIVLPDQWDPSLEGEEQEDDEDEVPVQAEAPPPTQPPVPQPPSREPPAAPRPTSTRRLQPQQAPPEHQQVLMLAGHVLYPTCFCASLPGLESQLLSARGNRCDSLLAAEVMLAVSEAWLQKCAVLCSTRPCPAPWSAGHCAA